MRKTPSVWSLENLILHCDPKNPNGTTQAGINGKWVPARPEGYWSLRERIRCAWIVFTGKADAVTWPEGQ